MKKLILTYGLLAGLVMSAMLVVMLPFKDRIAMERSMLIGYASMVAAFLLVYFGVRRYRDEIAGGAVSFGRAFGVGMLIVLVASVLYTATWEVVFFAFTPEFLADYQAQALEQLRAGGATAAELEAERAEMARFAELYRNPAINVAITLLEPLPVGLVMSLVSAGILRRPAPTGEGRQAVAGAS